MTSTIAERSLRACRRSLEMAFLVVLNAALYVLSYLPYRIRRAGLRSAFVCLAPVMAGLDLETPSRAFAATLAYSRQDGRKFACRKMQHDMIAMIEWLALGRRSVAGLVDDIRNISSDASDDLRWVAMQRGTIIGTMHFGPYALGLVWLIHSYFQQRKVIILKKDTGDEEARAIARLGDLGAQVEFVSPTALAEFHRIIKEVRHGAIVIVMIDLPPAASRSDAFDLLGHQVAVATGAVDLAALGRAPLVLLRVRAGMAGDRVEIGDIFDVAHQDAGSRDRAVSRITRFVADTLQRYPEQWHMWARFAEYLPSHPGAAS